MDYDQVELTVAGVLVLIPIVVVPLIGAWCLANPPRRMPWFFFLGPLASLFYIWGAGVLAMTMFPPPYSSYFASGRGLDLRGIGIMFGAMAGGAAGVVTSVVLCLGNLVRQFIQEPRNRVPVRT